MDVVVPQGKTVDRGDTKQESRCMNRELLMLVEAISREKNVERDVVLGAVEAGPGAGDQKAVPGEVDIRVSH
jgi:hypothetical protein